MSNVNNDAIQNPEKDPQEWVTGDEPMTGPQKSYIETLERQTGHDVDTDDLTKADASNVIEDLQSERDS
jgi:hypothetical protein